MSKHSLGQDPDTEILTPHLLIKSYNPICLDIVPSLFVKDSKEDMNDPDYIPGNLESNAQNKYLQKLKKIKNNLTENYYNEFLHQLFIQSIDKSDRYKLKNYTELSKGDIVLICLKNTKRSHYPKGIVLETYKNSKDQITSAKIKRANNKTETYHVTDLILILKNDPSFNLI